MADSTITVREPTYDYSMIGSFGSDAVQSVNGDTLNKLRAADEEQIIAPIDEKLADWEVESEFIATMSEKLNDMLETTKLFDVDNGKDNLFNQVLTDATGTSAVFDMLQGNDMELGTTTVHVDQLAQKDVYQSNTFTDPEVEVVTGATEEDVITVGIAGKPTYQSSKVEDGSTTLTDGTFTINFGSGTLDITTSGSTLTDVKDLINNHTDNNVIDSTSTTKNVVATIENDRLTIRHGDEETELTFTDGDNILSDIGIVDSVTGDAISGKKFSAAQVDRTYTGTDTVADTSALVGSGTFTISREDGKEVEFETTSDTTWEDFKDMIDDSGYFSATFDSDDKLQIRGSDASISLTFTENLANVDSSFSEVKTLVDKTYEELAEDINEDEDINASVQEVSDGEYRLVIKSVETGEDNALTINEGLGINLGYTDSDGDGTADSTNHVLTASNLKATIDGVLYEKSSNVMDINDNLTMTALKVDEPDEYSSVTISRDTSAVSSGLELFIAQYNDLQSGVNEELNDVESSLDYKSDIRGIINDLKSKIFDSYNGENIFNHGIELDQYGNLSLDDKKFNEALKDDPDTIRNLFVGTYLDEGIGANLTDFLDNLDGYGGVITTYGERMLEEKAAWEKDIEDELEKLDTKYTDMSVKWSSYGAAISKMESSFSGLKMMIEQESSGN
ncbi:MAG: flagellar filament capping protein FliD [Campylobacterota bacterium]|nr:flagellar filament capping protein FliD [Campylobacterota bacterium]